MARMPLKIAAVIVTALSAFGFVLEEQRIEDRTPIYSVDREMDGRLNAYLPVVRAAAMIDRKSETHLLTIAEQWREGRESGALRDPMPARYGDGEGGRTDLVAEAVKLSFLITSRAEGEPDMRRARRLFTAATEPLRTVQYADLATLKKVHTRRNWMARVMMNKGFSPEQVETTVGVLRPNGEKLAELLRHLSKLRNQFRVRFGDDEALQDADPFFEALVRGKVQRTAFARG